MTISWLLPFDIVALDVVFELLLFCFVSPDLNKPSDIQLKMEINLPCAVFRSILPTLSQSTLTDLGGRVLNSNSKTIDLENLPGCSPLRIGRLKLL